MSAGKAGAEYELWQQIVAADSSGPYKWMVWTVGPMSGGEEWFKTRAEAEAFMQADEEEAS